MTEQFPEKDHTGIDYCTCDLSTPCPVHRPENDETLTDEQIDADMRIEVPGFDPDDAWGEHSNGALRAAYRAGFEAARRRITPPASVTAEEA